MEGIDYSRQEEMTTEVFRNATFNGTNIIVGCGGVGFWLAIFLAMNGAERLVLIDGDKIEPSNLNRLPILPRLVGHNKTLALRKMIKMIRPECNIACVPYHLTEDNMVTTFADIISVANRNKALSFVWDCTDNVRSQIMLYKYVKRHLDNSKFKYCKLGYDGYNVGAYTNYDVWFDADTYQPGYRRTVANSLTSAVAAAFGLFWQAKRIMQEGISTPLRYSSDSLDLNLMDLLQSPLESEERIHDAEEVPSETVID